MRVVFGREFEVLMQMIADGEQSVSFMYQGSEYQANLIGEFVPGVEAASVSVDPSTGSCTAAGLATIDVVFYGLNSSHLPSNAKYVVTVEGQIHVSDKQGYQLNVIKQLDSRVVLDENVEQVNRFFEADVSLGFREPDSRNIETMRNAIAVLDRGKRDFLSSKWADAVLNVLEQHNGPFRVAEFMKATGYPAFIIEDAVWRANLVRRNPLDPINVGSAEINQLLSEVELYLITVDSDWSDRWWRGFDGYTNKDPVAQVAARLDMVSNALAQTPSFVWATTEVNQALVERLDREKRSLIGSIQQANASKQVAAALANKKAQQPAAPVAEVAEVDVSKIKPMQSIEISFLMEGDEAVLKVEDELDQKYFPVKVRTADEFGIDFEVVGDSERTFTVDRQAIKVGSNEFEVGNKKFHLYKNV